MTTEHEMAVAMATEIGKQVPVKQVYDDAASPATRQLGAAMEDIIKAIRLIGFPIQWLAVQQDKYRNFIEGAKAPIPVERRILPAPQILSQILEGIKYELDDEPIANMFQNLLGSAMDVDKVNLVHPSFANIIRNMSPDEAKILNHLYDKNIFSVDVAEGVLHIGSAGVKIYQVQDVGLTFPNNANFYFDLLFTSGLISWDHKQQSSIEYEGVRAGRSALMLSRAGKQLMDACRRDG